MQVKALVIISEDEIEAEKVIRFPTGTTYWGAV